MKNNKHFGGDSKPEFCIITPIPYMSYVTVSRRHLVLAHLVATNEQYASFYKRLSDDGDVIIMDNGAFELGESYDPEKLVSLGRECGADVIVLPDYPLQHSQKTIDAAKQYISVFKDAGFGTMFVPQSETGDLEDWISCYVWATKQHDIDIIGMSILGIPNALPHVPPSYARVVMTQLLIDRKFFSREKYHHYLGLTAGPNLEIPSLIKMGALNSCDSSNPVWMAILGHEYSYNTDSFLSVKKVKTEVNFMHPWTEDNETHRRINTNLVMTLDLFRKNQ